MTRFFLRRRRDVSGVSGVGDVANGVLFDDGTVAIRWAGAHATTTIYTGMADVRAIHLHGGATRLIWLDGCRGQGAYEAGLDAMENAPNGSVAKHVPAHERAAATPDMWRAPAHVLAADVEGYLEGYRDATL